MKLTPAPFEIRRRIAVLVGSTQLTESIELDGSILGGCAHVPAWVEYLRHARQER